MKINKNIKLLLSYIILGVIILVFIKKFNDMNNINSQTNNIIESMSEYKADFEDQAVQEDGLLGVELIPSFTQQWEVDYGRKAVVKDPGISTTSSLSSSQSLSSSSLLSTDKKGKGYIIHDTPNWHNGFWNTCDLYVKYGWCKDGKIASANNWPGGKAYNYPEKNCVKCGKSWGE